MNDPEDIPTDETLTEWLAPLRGVECQPEVRNANRRAIDNALLRHAHQRWWRRSVSVPMPLAVAASVAFVVTGAAALWPIFGESNDTAISRPQQSAYAESPEEHTGWSLTQSYILSIESFARMQETFRTDITENRNDT